MQQRLKGYTLAIDRPVTGPKTGQEEIDLISKKIDSPKRLIQKSDWKIYFKSDSRLDQTS
jgi:hypothetical protein